MGCQMNEYDSEKMADVLRESHGYELTDSPDDADLLCACCCSHTFMYVCALPSHDLVPLTVS